ncbi:transposase [Micrococcales bacterium 31B]|nr:transposase [Micrococcales bacterium 31B]
MALDQQVQLALLSLRTNLTQHTLALIYCVSQPTVSRIINRITPLIAHHLRHNVPTVYDLNPRQTHIIDGTVLPCWSWKHTPTLSSGKHHTTGINVQVACDITGKLLWVSDPLTGNIHDSKAIREHGLLGHIDPQNVIADKGYVGLGAITPIKKMPRQHLRDDQKTFNRKINQIRYVVERCIANLKTWRTFHTDYRRPLHTFPDTLNAILGLILHLQNNADE